MPISILEAYRQSEKLERHIAAAERKHQAERAVIDAAVAWRKRKTDDHGEYAALVIATDRLIALG